MEQPEGGLPKKREIVCDKARLLSFAQSTKEIHIVFDHQYKKFPHCLFDMGMCCLLTCVMFRPSLHIMGSATQNPNDLSTILRQQEVKGSCNAGGMITMQSNDSSDRC